jgi:hypothetical protein
VEALVNLRNNYFAAAAENDPPVDGPPFFLVVSRRRRRQPRPLLVVAREEVGRDGVPVEGPSFSPRDRIQRNLSRPLPVAREEVGCVRELVSGDRVGNILAENANNNAQLLDVADTTAAVGENIDYQANNNDTHGVADAPVGDVPRDNIDDHHMANVDPQQPRVQVPPDIPVDGHQHLQPRRLPTRPALTRTQQRDDYVRLREIESERCAEQRARQRAYDVGDAHVHNITGQQLLNVDNHQDVVGDDPQELINKSGAASEQLGVHESESEQQFAAREEEGVQEEINANVDPQEPGVQVPPDIPVDGHQHLLPRRLPTRPALTRTQQRDDYVRLREIESERCAEQRARQCAYDVGDAYVHNIIGQQLLNVDNHHDVVADDPQQELMHDSGAAREQLGVHESESEQQFAAREQEEGVGEEINAEQRARDPVGDVILDIGPNKNIGNVENNEENQDDRRDVVDFPGIEDKHEYELSSDITQINHRLELFIQQQQLKDDKINELECRIKELEHWKITRISTSWPSCTSVGGINFLAADCVSQDILAGGENEDNMSFNGGDDNGRRQRKRRRGWNPPLLESTVQQPPTKRRRAIAPNNDQGQSPYYRDDFVNNARRTNAPDPVIDYAHAGLTNCDLICYSNAIFQGLASCLHVSEFLQSPPKEEHRLRFPLYHAFASVMSSMVSGQESVVNPTPFVNDFRESHENYKLQQGMYFNSQWMNKLTINVPLMDSSSR